MQVRGDINLPLHVSALALLIGGGFIAPVSKAYAQDVLPAPAERRAPSTTERKVAFTVPLVFGQRALGDVLIEVQGRESLEIDAATLRGQLDPLLNEAGREALGSAIGGQQTVGPEDLASSGIGLRFDRNRLSLILSTIPGEFRPVQSLGRQGREGNLPNLPIAEPENVSAYLNVNLNLDYDTQTNFRDPEVFLNGAARIGGIVVEYDGAFSDQFGDGYRFYRRGVRAVYDQPEAQRRFTAGDLRATNLPILRTPFIGGVSVEKGRRIFDPFLPVARLGGREIFLDSQSTVDVLLNGELYQTFQLDPGSYDLADLPVQLGANDVQLIVNDSAGRRQLIGFDYFFEPLDLPAGEEEYSFAVGMLADGLEFEPSYSNDPAVSAFYRRAFNSNLILGGAIQASKELQLGAITTSFAPQVIPGAFDIEAAVSTGDIGTGIAIRGNYRYRSGASFARSEQFSINVDYETAGFQTLSDVLPIQFDLLSVSVSYSKGFSARTFVNVGALHTKVIGAMSDRTSIFGDLVHRLNERIRLTAGVEYGTGNFQNDNFGVRLGISVALGDNARANADYRSRTETFRATLSRGVDDEVGAIGYDLGFTDTRGQTSADANITYIGNRFDARLLVLTDGPNLGSFVDRQAGRLQIGTSLALAGKSIGIGRPINDSFAIVKPNRAFKDVDVITGRNLADNRYDARSGALGGAVQGDLVSYTGQGLQYDVADENVGIDIGDGVVQVDPPYRAGYAITVGSEYYASATGFLLRGSTPAGLAGGTVRSIGDADFEPQAFFTNSAGRFAILGLAPGGEYEVSLTNGETFTFTVPVDQTALYKLGDVDLNSQSGSE